MDTKALIKTDYQAAGRLRSMWLRYKKAPWGWRIVVPAGLATIAGTLINWAWQVLEQGEYGVAMLLTFFFFIVGIGAVAAIPRRIIKAIGCVIVVVVALFSGGVIWKNKGDRPWTTLMQKELPANGSRTVDNSANVDVSLYEPLGPKFVEDSGGQSSAIAVQNDETPDSVADRCEGNVLKYTYDRLDDGKIQIKPEMPYLSQLREEIITNFPICPFPLPNLSIKVVNNTSRTLVISEVAIKIKSSSIISRPMLRISGGKSIKQLYLYNEGWEDLLTPTVEYGVTNMRSCKNVNFGNTKYSKLLPTIQDSTSIDISQEILNFENHTSVLTRYPDGSFVCVFGKVNYKTKTGLTRTVTFRTSVAVQELEGMKSGSMLAYGVVLEAGKQGYTKWLSVAHELKPGESDLFLVRVNSNKWAQFDLGFSFRTTEGNYLPGNDLFLEVFVPRFISSHSLLKESFKERVN